MGDRRAMRGRRLRGVDLGKRGRGLKHPRRLPERVKLLHSTQVARGLTGIAVDASGGSAICPTIRRGGPSLVAREAGMRIGKRGASTTAISAARPDHVTV